MSTKHYITYKRYEEKYGIGEYKTDRPQIPGFVLDQIADEKFSGKYDLHRANKCKVCNTFRSASGTCFCD